MPMLCNKEFKLFKQAHVNKQRGNTQRTYNLDSK